MDECINNSDGDPIKSSLANIVNLQRFKARADLQKLKCNTIKWFITENLIDTILDYGFKCRTPEHSDNRVT